jgi:hypothetical protein
MIIISLYMLYNTRLFQSSALSVNTFSLCKNRQYFKKFEVPV